MLIKNKVAQAVIVASLSSQGFAVELGDFNGTQFSVGGYLKAEGVFSNPDEGSSTFDGSARQSRVNFTASRTVEDHKIRGFIEADFWDNNTTATDSTYAYRLRHATITVDNLTVGQTWNGQFFANAPFDTEMINLWGLGIGTIAGNGAVVRPDLVVHYATKDFRLTFQDPVYSDASYPDMVAAFTHRTESGHAFNIAVTGRDVDMTPSDTTDNDSKFGAALSLAAKLNFGDTSLSLSGFTGKGAGVYAGWGYLGATGASGVTEVDGQGDLVTLTGFTAGIGHKLSEKVRVNLRYGQVTSDEVSSTLTDDTLKLTLANVIYTYVPGLEFGLELRDQNMANRPSSAVGASSRPAGQQVEVMAMYKF